LAQEQAALLFRYRIRDIASGFAMSQPISIAVIVSGWDTPAGKQFAADAETKKQFHYVPLWSMLTDRVTAEQVRHKETDEMTMLAIYSQMDFVNAIVSLAEYVIASTNEPRDVVQLIHAECRTGWHRASTFGNTFAEVINSVEGSAGNRLFNCQCYSLLKYTRADAINQQIQSAIGWVFREDPHLMPGGAGRDRATLYAYHAVAQREQSEANFKHIWDWVDAFNALEDDDDAYLDAVPPIVVKVESRSRSRSPSGPLPLVTPPWKRMTPKAKVRPVVRPVQLAKLPAPPIDDPPSHMLPWKNIEADSDVAQSWSGVLDEYNVDAASQHSIFALAQASGEGRQRAFAVMTKLFKKAADGERIANSSAFVWSSVKRAWDSMGWNQ